MQSFEFHCPTEIVFGKGAEEKAAEKIRKYGGSRVFVVYGGGSVVKSGLLAKIEQEITAAGLAFKALGGVQPNPRLGLAREGVKQALEFAADFILAVGGGSVIDTAKAVAHGIANPDNYISATRLSDMQKVSEFVKQKYGYDTGSYTSFPADETNLKLLGRIDWNINQYHKLAVRYNYTKNTAWNQTNGMRSLKPSCTW